MMLNPCFVKREIYGKTILMPVRENQISDSPIALNETAALILNQITDGRDEEENRIEIRKLFEKEYGQEGRNSADSFVDYLIRQGIVIGGENQYV